MTQPPHSPTSVPLSVDLRIAFVLSGIYGVTGAVAAVLLVPVVAQHTEIKFPLPLPVFSIVLSVQLTIIYGLLGWAGLRMARHRGLEPAPMLTGLWLDQRVSFPWRGLAIAAIAGLLSGAALVVAVKIISIVFPGTLPSMLHPPNFLTALSASTAASFGEEILWRLFVLSLILRLLPAGIEPRRHGDTQASLGKGERSARAIANAISAILFALLHTPGLIWLYGGFSSVPALAWVWIILFNALVGLVFGALYLRAGIGAAIAGHWFCDLVWHVGGRFG